MAKAFENGYHERKIKRLLRHRATREYFKEDGWTKNPDEARCFSDVVEVAEACARFGLENVELTLCVEGSTASELFCTPMRY